jgi:hypothetical protein
MMPTGDKWTRVENNEKSAGRPGIPVDYEGSPTIDPTKNVLDLVKAESKYQDGMRGELEKQFNGRFLSVSELLKLYSDNLTGFQTAMREAETRRIDQLAETRQEFQNTIRDMLAESVRTTSTLVSTQLVQIQATFDTRVSKLEAGAFTQAGKSSVADPALADAMARMSSSIVTMKADQVESWAKLTAAITSVGSKEQKTTSERMGQGQVIAWIIGAAMLMAAIATPLIAFLALRPHP